VEHVSGEVQVADIMTKPMPKPRFQKLRKLLGLDILADTDESVTDTK
jgi:hypothetical protein